jgi:GTP-binding protein
LLLHVVDISATEGRDPIEDVKNIDRELARYSDRLAERPQVLVCNKADLVWIEEEPYVREFEAFAKELGREIFYVSAATGEGVKELIARVSELLRDLPPLTVYEPEVTVADLTVKVDDVMQTTVRRENDVWFVEAEWLRNFMGQINFDDYESLNFFQKVLTKNGVFNLLRERGIEEGHTVNIYDYEFDFVY